MVRSVVCFVLAMAFACGGPAPKELEVAQPADAQSAADSEPSLEPGVVELSERALSRGDLEIVPVNLERTSDVFTVNGTVELNEDRTAHIGALVEGIVVECCKSVGSFVRKGESMAVLHSHQTHELLSQFRQAQAELEARRSEADLAEKAFRRASRLHELKAGPLAAVEQTETALARAEKSVVAAEAELDGARAHFEYLDVEPPDADAPVPDHLVVHVRAPFDGTVVDRAIAPGAVVQVSTELYTVSDLGSVWIQARVPEEQLGRVRPGMPVAVRSRAYPDRTFSGRVSRIESALDPATRLAEVRCSVPNPGAALKSGMYVEVDMVSTSSRERLTVPLGAVQSGDHGPSVFVPESARRFRERTVRLGEEFGGRVEILEGLVDGERVVVEGSFLLHAESMRGELAE